ncbi:unnamed protein product [Leptidea sinapis]|uniref:Uncharacterized protein n=1 Tax=Leptidea sinapis TaxID=189913 RepID=A0A5E4PWG8_9NEOP|nr:unnamed protein product [Leptidea sinapis]
MSSQMSTRLTIWKYWPTMENRQLSVDEVNSYYANIGRQLVDKIHNSAFAARSHTSILCPNSFVLFSTDESEVERVVTSLKNNSAMGWDGISTGKPADLKRS